MKRGFSLLPALAGLALLVPAPTRSAEIGIVSGAALQEVRRIRQGLKVMPAQLEDFGRRLTSHGRPSEEIEGWKRTPEGNRWPVDQATFDIATGLLSKYVNFSNTSRRKSGESILPMSSVSVKADAYLSLFYKDQKLSLESIERFGVSGKASVYYELRYSPHPQDVQFFSPLVRILVDASNGNLYRFELAVDYLEARYPPSTMISGKSAVKIAEQFLRKADLTPYVGQGSALKSVSPPTLYFIRPNRWLGVPVPPGGKARAAWVVPFRTGDGAAEVPHLIFIEASSGKVVGGIKASS